MAGHTKLQICALASVVSPFGLHWLSPKMANGFLEDGQFLVKLLLSGSLGQGFWDKVVFFLSVGRFEVSENS